MSESLERVLDAIDAGLQKAPLGGIPEERVNVVIQEELAIAEAVGGVAFDVVLQRVRERLYARIDNPEENPVDPH